MILKKIPCRDPVGVAEYIFGPGRRNAPGRAETVAGTLLGRDPKSLSKELLALIKLRPDVARPLLHISISLPGQDRRLDAVEVEQMGQELARVLDVEAWGLVFHSDSDHPHWHWIASRIGFGGRLSREQLRDYRMYEQFARRCEQWFALTEVVSPIRPCPERPHGRSENSKRPTRAELEARDQGRPLARDRLRTAIDIALVKGYRGQAFIDYMRGRGFTAHITRTRGVPCGISWVVHHEGRRFRGSSLGNGYSGKTFFIKGGFDVRPIQKPSQSFRCSNRTRIEFHIRPYDIKRAWACILRDHRREQRKPKARWWQSLSAWLWCDRVAAATIPRGWCASESRTSVGRDVGFYSCPRFFTGAAPTETSSVEITRQGTGRTPERPQDSRPSRAR